MNERAGGDEGREDELASVMAEVADRLRRRGMVLDGRETSEDLANLLDSVERFERQVEAHGGDLMMDTRPAREPDDPEFVLPVRGPHESVAKYLGRIDEATVRLRRRHPA